MTTSAIIDSTPSLSHRLGDSGDLGAQAIRSLRLSVNEESAAFEKRLEAAARRCLSATLHAAGLDLGLDVGEISEWIESGAHHDRVVEHLGPDLENWDHDGDPSAWTPGDSRCESLADAFLRSALEQARCGCGSEGPCGM